jgi:hypothetical protein
MLVLQSRENPALQVHWVALVLPTLAVVSPLLLSGSGHLVHLSSFPASVASVTRFSRCRINIADLLG